MSARRSPRRCRRPASSKATRLARSARASRWRRCDAMDRGIEGSDDLRGTRFVATCFNRLPRCPELSGSALLLTGCFLGPVKPHRIVDQQFALQVWSGRNVRNKIDQQAVVRHVVLQIRMRPVGAPEYTIRESLDDAPGEWDHIAVGVLLAVQRGRARLRQPFRATDLGPDVYVIPHE